MANVVDTWYMFFSKLFVLLNQTDPLNVFGAGQTGSGFWTNDRIVGLYRPPAFKKCLTRCRGFEKMDLMLEGFVSLSLGL